MPSFGIGITTYRDKKSENISTLVYNKTKAGKSFEAAKKVNEVVHDTIDWVTTQYNGYPAVGIYEGGEEPSAHVYVETSVSGVPFLKKELKQFKILAKQDSILLYEFVKSGHSTLLEIQLKPRTDIKKFGAAIEHETKGKLGGFLTYIYALNRVVIVNVEQFDGLTRTEFNNQLKFVNKVVREYNAELFIKNVKVTVI